MKTDHTVIPALLSKQYIPKILPALAPRLIPDVGGGDLVDTHQAGLQTKCLCTYLQDIALALLCIHIQQYTQLSK